jgi:hypothetical protein
MPDKTQTHCKRAKQKTLNFNNKEIKKLWKVTFKNRRDSLQRIRSPAD